MNFLKSKSLLSYRKHQNPPSKSEHPKKKTLFDKPPNTEIANQLSLFFPFFLQQSKWQQPKGDEKH